ncbi:uncharacterized protein LOC143039600 isoform X2 [Oratosquilla oratoria]|uniref:uncharacterized protein LOC143039600 isoform X2 n=1 Tax=Oratosquilla oratoria TaxID=337810 RepID=UPI003F75D620
MKMEVLESLVNKADFLIEQSHEALVQGSCSVLQGQPLLRKLAAIYAEEAAKNPRLKSISLTHKLLEKMVKKEGQNCLIVNLYRGNEGYSLAVKMSSGLETETIKLSYEEEDFLSFIDNEQLPPMLLDLLDESNIDIYHSGCVIAEIRDYRRTIDSSYDTKYVLLSPTNQTLAADVAAMTQDKDWTSEERLLLEAEIVKRTAPPLNLSPSPIVAVVNNKLHQRKYKFSTLPIKRAARRFSQVALNRQKKFEEAPAPKSLRLYNFLERMEKKDKRHLAKTVSKPLIPMVTEEVPKLAVPENIDVMKVARAYEKPRDVSDNSLVFIEEYVLETEWGQGRIYLTKLTISQRKTDDLYFGELYVDRDYQEGKQNGSTCRFPLGTQQQVRKYIQQFKEIFTEEGRKSVKITHQVAGQPVRSMFTQGTRDKKEVVDLHKQSPASNQAQPQIQTQVQVQPQAIAANVSLSGQGSVATPNTIATSAVVQHTQPNVIIVSNGEGSVKKSVTVVTKPVAMGTTNTLTSLITAQPSHASGTGQQVVVGRGLNLSNFLSGRTVATNAGVGAASSVSSVLSKLAVAVTTGPGGSKLSLPSLTAQLNRPIPAYSQAVTPAKTQVVSQVGTLGDSLVTNQSKSPATSESTTSTINAPGLQALLEGTPSADNPAPQGRGPTLLERLSAQSANNAAAAAANKAGVVKVSPANLISSTASVGSSAAAAVLRSDSGSTGPPPNINIANLNLPEKNYSKSPSNHSQKYGLNVAGLQSLTANIQGLQNVQVSIPGLAVPISLSLNVPVSTSTGVVMTTHPPTNVVTKMSATTAVTTATTVMIASPPTIQQGQVVQLPISQLSSSQLAAQLTKPGTQQGASSSTIPVLQVQGGLFTSMQRGTAGGANTTASSAAQQTVQVALPSPQASVVGAAPSEVVSSVVAPSQPSVVTLASKQQLQRAFQKGQINRTNLQQKLAVFTAAKRTQQQQQQQQTPQQQAQQQPQQQQQQQQQQPQQQQQQPNQ